MRLYKDFVIDSPENCDFRILEGYFVKKYRHDKDHKQVRQIINILCIRGLNLTKSLLSMHEVMFHISVFLSAGRPNMQQQREQFGYFFVGYKHGLPE